MSALNHQQQKLLAALRAEHLIPKLYARLSLERYTASDEDIRRMSSWPESIAKDEGWQLLKLSIDEPRAWPSVWHQAVERGFSPVSDHHHALLFERLSERFAKDEDFEGALWAFNECIGAWRRVMRGDYVLGLLHDLAPEADAQTTQAHRDALKDLLDPLVDARRTQLRAALRLEDTPQQGEQIERRVTRFAWGALEMIPLILNDVGMDPLGALARAKARAKSHQQQLRAQVVERFKHRLEALDLSEETKDSVMPALEWAHAAFELIGADLESCIELVHQCVELGWTLRRLGRDESDEFKLMFAMMNPFNEQLANNMDDPISLGHNSKVADFLVFRGELATARPERKAIFERALTICPGHRNSTMLYSYELIYEANQLLGQSKVRDLTGVKGGGQGTLLEAWAKVQQVEQLYPQNKNLEKTRAQAIELAKQAHIELPGRAKSTKD